MWCRDNVGLLYKAATVERSSDNAGKLHKAAPVDDPAPGIDPTRTTVHTHTTTLVVRDVLGVDRWGISNTGKAKILLSISTEGYELRLYDMLVTGLINTPIYSHDLRYLHYSIQLL